MKSLLDKILDKISEYDLEIIKQFKSEDENFIILENCTISINDQKELFVSFNINVLPSFAARIILILKQITGIKVIYIGEDYTFNEEGKFIDGDEAEIYKNSMIRENILKDFMKEQNLLYYLHNAKPYSC